MIDVLAALGGSLILELLLKGMLVIGGAGLIARLLRRTSAATRHVAWTVGMLALVMLPFQLVSLPDWTLPAFDGATVAADGSERPAESIASTTSTSVVRGSVAPAVVQGRAKTAPPEGGDRSAGAIGSGHGSRDVTPQPLETDDRATVVQTSQGVGTRIALALALFWVAGATLLLLLASRDLFRIAMITRFGSVPAPEGDQSRAHAVARSLGLRRGARVRFTHWTDVPVTWGVLRPVVLFPHVAARWSPERTRVALVHELAHVKRLDYVWHFLTEAACALHWLNPLVWVARAEMRREQERASDDVVLRSGMRSTDYAEHLVGIARSISRPVLNATTAMARSTELGTRVNAILDRGLDHRPMARGRAWVATIIVLALGMGVAGATVPGTLEAPNTVNEVWSLAGEHASMALPALLEQLEHPSADRRGVAALSLGELRATAAIEPLVTALGDPDPFVRENAAVALAQLGGDRAAEAVLQLVHDPEPSVRSVATWALGELGGERAADALLAMLAEDTDAHTRSMAAGAATRIDDVDILPALVALLETEVDSHRRADIVMALGELADARAIEHVGRIVTGDPDPMTRRIAVMALRHVDAPGRVDVWLKALEDGDWTVRNRAVLELAEVEDDPRALTAILEALRDPQHQVRLNAAWALEDRGD